MAHAVVAEVYISDEMLAVGVEAMREAKALCLTEAEAVREIYMAMHGQGIKCIYEGEAPVH